MHIMLLLTVHPTILWEFRLDFISWLLKQPLKIQNVHSGQLSLLSGPESGHYISLTVYVSGDSEKTSIIMRLDNSLTVHWIILTFHIFMVNK